MISFNTLAQYLPTGSIEFVGNNQVKLNLNVLTGDNLSLDSSSIKAVTKLFDSLANATTAINQSRAAQTPPLGPISFVSKDLGGTPQEPMFEFTVSIGVDKSAFMDNLIDPTGP